MHYFICSTQWRIISMLEKNNTSADSLLEPIQRLFQRSSDCRFLLDGKGRIVLHTPVFARLASWRGEQTLGLDLSEVVGRENQTIITNAIAKANKEEQINTSAFIELKQENGRSERCYCAIESFTMDQTYYDVLIELKEAESNATEGDSNEAELKYQSIIENMELGLIEVDRKGIIVKAYDRFCEMVGYEPEELLGKFAVDLFLPEEYNYLVAEHTSNRIKGIPTVYEVEMIKKCGERIWVLISGAPIFDRQKRTVGSIGIHYDISHIKEKEHLLKEAKDQAESARKAETDFIANVSHEIRTPMNAVLGLTHLMFDTPLNQEQKEYISSIARSAEILRALISDVLDVNRLDSGELAAHMDDIPFKDTLSSMLKTFQFTVGSKPVEMVLKYDHQIPEIIESDGLLLNQILTNLIGNALKFTNEGFVMVGVNFHDAERTYLSIEVKDTGIGIPQDQLSKIFQRFQQGDEGRKPQYQGTGLGLAIAMEYAELLGGTIKVESEVNNGTCFRLIIPYRASTNSQLQEIKKSGEVHMAVGQRILVVEDNEMNRKYACRLLQKWNLKYEVAKHGGEAIKIMKEREFDVILMDIHMPELDGYQTTIQIRHLLNNGNRTVPVIGLSAFNRKEDIAKAIEAGMTDYLRKPYLPDELKTILFKYLDNDNIKSKTEYTDYCFDESLDTKCLEEFYEGDVEYALEMFQMFIQSFPRYWSEVKAAQKEVDYDKARELFHKIKPTFSMVGLPELTEKFKLFETLAKDKDPSVWVRMDACTKNIKSWFQTIEIEVKRMTNHLEHIS